MFEKQIEWLLAAGGPVIRYRTASELIDGTDVSLVKEMSQALIESPQVRKWLDFLQPPAGYGHQMMNSLHGCKGTCFENTAFKLASFGLKAGIPDLDERIQPFLSWLEGVLGNPDIAHMHLLSNKLFLTVNLCRLGYGTAPAVETVAEQYLEMLHKTATNGYDFLLPPGSCKGVPKPWESWPVIKQEIGYWGLPNRNTLVLLAHLPTKMAIAKKAMIDEILKFTFDLRYLGHHAAISIASPGRYHAAGYGIWVPNIKSLNDDVQRTQLVGTIEALAPFASPYTHTLVLDGINHLNSFRTVRDTWLFPKSYLQEKYYYMGLEENRHKEQTYELESTFRMLILFKTTGLGEA